VYCILHCYWWLCVCRMQKEHNIWMNTGSKSCVHKHNGNVVKFVDLHNSFCIKCSCMACGHIGATLQIRLNLSFLWPTVHKPKWQIDHFSYFCTDHGRMSSDTFLGPVWAHNPNGVIISWAVFAHMTTVSLYFAVGRPSLPSKLPTPMGGCPPPSNTCFLELTRILSPDGISIGWAVSAGLTSVTDQQTDRQTMLLCQ